MVTTIYPNSHISQQTLPHIVQQPYRPLLLVEGNDDDVETMLRGMVRKDDGGYIPFVSGSTEEAIEILGDIPLFNGFAMKPLPEALLRGVLSPLTGFNYELASTGLFYLVPGLLGHAGRIRTSYCGLKLLDHWASLNKRFAPFVDAFASDDVRKDIAADCHTLAMGKMPKWIKDDIEKANKIWNRYSGKVSRKKAIEERRLQVELARMYAQQRHNSLTGTAPTTYTSTTAAPSTLFSSLFGTKI